jgi:hypothetical protein
MKTKQWLILLTSCLALAAAPLTGCGDDTDPSANNGNNGVVNPDAGDNGDEDTGGEEDGGGETDTGDDTGVEEDTGDDTGGGGLGSCETNDFFSGQTYTEGDDPDAHNGGNPVEASTVTLDSAGLEAVLGAVPVDDPPQDENTDDDVDDSIVTLDTTLDVTGALVIATGRTDNADTTAEIEGNDWLYLQDADTTLVLNGGFVGSAYPDGAAPDTAVKIGDKVSFTVTGVRNFSGTPQIARVTDFVIDGSDNDVPFTDMTGADITMDSWGNLIRVSGQLTADNGSCGGSAICYEFTHGDPAKTITFRSNSQFVETGSCVTFFGPLGAFPGPLGSDPVPQVDEVNYGWTFTVDPT